MTPNLVTSGDSSNGSTPYDIIYCTYCRQTVDNLFMFGLPVSPNWTQLPRRARSMWFSRSAVQGHKCAERCCRAGVMRDYKLAAVVQRRRHLVSCRFTIHRLRPNNDKDHKNQLRHVCPSTLTWPQRPDPRFCRAVTVWRLCVRADTDDFMTTHHSVTRSKRCGIKSLRL